MYVLTIAFQLALMPSVSGEVGLDTTNGLGLSSKLTT